VRIDISRNPEWKSVPSERVSSGIRVGNVI
jgi:hypothetical protein